MNILLSLSPKKFLGLSVYEIIITILRIDWSKLYFSSSIFKLAGEAKILTLLINPCNSE